jgi:hypothetical protein
VLHTQDCISRSRCGTKVPHNTAGSLSLGRGILEDGEGGLELDSWALAVSTAGRTRTPGQSLYPVPSPIWAFPITFLSVGGIRDRRERRATCQDELHALSRQILHFI